jgi:hypothetical protein
MDHRRHDEVGRMTGITGIFGAFKTVCSMLASEEWPLCGSDNVRALETPLKEYRICAEAFRSHARRRFRSLRRSPHHRTSVGGVSAALTVGSLITCRLQGTCNIRLLKVPDLQNRLPTLRARGTTWIPTRLPERIPATWLHR